MKKEWEKPELEVLDVNQTMHGQEGDRLDKGYDAGTLKGDLTFS